MKKIVITAAALVALSALTGCNKEEEVVVPPQSSMPDAGSTGSSTPAGAASETSGNQAPENTTDAVPTQQQLDPAAPSGTPATKP